MVDRPYHIKKKQYQTSDQYCDKPSNRTQKPVLSDDTWTTSETIIPMKRVTYEGEYK